MTKTRHFQKRLSQRGITLDLVRLACDFGQPVRDRIILSRKHLQALIAAARHLEKAALKAVDKGGIVVVEADGRLVTAYDIDSYDRQKAKK